MDKKPLLAFLCAIAVVLSGAALHAAEADDDWPDWVLEQERLKARIAAVNEGDLEFIAGRNVDTAHLHQNDLMISERSLQDGWVVLKQCHTHLDQVSAAQIIFRPERSRGLKVTRARNIAQAYAKGSSVQLRGIGSDSELCLSVETRALDILDDGVFELNNGPFMRRFLDGYYPMTVRLRIAHPKNLVLADHSPEAQPGFSVDQGAGWVSATATFEGQLRTRFRFLAD